MSDERISKELKIHVAKELVSSYLRGEAGKHVTPDQLGGLFKQVYESVDQVFPEPEKRPIGLGM